MGIDDETDVVGTKLIILIYLFAVDGQEFGAGVQHIQQGHLAVGIHLIYMNHIAVALKFDDLVIVGCMGCQANHAQCKQYARKIWFHIMMLTYSKAKV